MVPTMLTVQGLCQKIIRKNKTVKRIHQKFLFGFINPLVIACFLTCCHASGQQKGKSSSHYTTLWVWEANNCFSLVPARHINFFPIIAFVALYFHLHLSNIEKTSLIIIKFHGFQDPPSALLEVTMLTTKLKS